MIHKYYKLKNNNIPSVHLPKGAEYKPFGEVRFIPSIGWEAVGEVYIDRKLKQTEELRYELWEAPK